MWGAPCVGTWFGKSQAGFGGITTTFVAEIAISTSKGLHQMDYNKLINDLITELSLIRKHGQPMAKSMRLAKNAAWLAAKRYHQLRETHHNEFLQFCNGDVEGWVNREFAPIRQYLMDDPWTLIKNVGQGMTRAQYLAEAPGVLRGGRCTTKNTGTRSELPDPDKAVPATMDFEQSSAHFRRLYETARKENVELRRRVARLERALRQLTV
jgi:hypothetical protein